MVKHADSRHKCSSVASNPNLKKTKQPFESLNWRNNKDQTFRSSFPNKINHIHTLPKVEFIVIMVMTIIISAKLVVTIKKTWCV